MVGEFACVFFRVIVPKSVFATESVGLFIYVKNTVDFVVVEGFVVDVKAFVDYGEVVWCKSFWWDVRVRCILWSPIDGDQSFLVEWIGGKSSSKC